ncbi:hypothetical protein [Ferruginibacter sp.]
MKKIVLLVIGFCFLGLVNAQVKPITTPVVKQTQIVKLDSNSGNNQKIPIAASIKQALPTTVKENLVLYKWKATRWMENALWKGELSAPNLTFNGNGTVSCGSSIFSSGDNQLVNGTYTVNGNNVIIVLKKDTSAILTGNLVYDSNSKKCNGSYNLQVLKGYAAGNSAQSWMKLEINP